MAELPGKENSPGGEVLCPKCGMIHFPDSVPCHLVVRRSCSKDEIPHVCPRCNGIGCEECNWVGTVWK